MITAFSACVHADAALSTMRISGRGDVNKAFHKFYETFKVAYLLALNNSAFREVPYGDDGGKLVDEVQKWFDTAKDRADSVTGSALFREFNLAIGRSGLLK